MLEEKLSRAGFVKFICRCFIVIYCMHVAFLRSKISLVDRVYLFMLTESELIQETDL